TRRSGEGTSDEVRRCVLEQDGTAGVGVGLSRGVTRPAPAAGPSGGVVWPLRRAPRARARGRRAARGDLRALHHAQLTTGPRGGFLSQEGSVAGAGGGGGG